MQIIHEVLWQIHLLAALKGVTACPGVRTPRFLSWREGSGVPCTRTPLIRRRGDSWPIAASSKASSSQPAIAATERNPGLRATSFSALDVARRSLGVFGNASRSCREPIAFSFPFLFLYLPSPFSTTIAISGSAPDYMLASSEFLRREPVTERFLSNTASPVAGEFTWRQRLCLRFSSWKLFHDRRPRKCIYHLLTANYFPRENKNPGSIRTMCSLDCMQRPRIRRPSSQPDDDSPCQVFWNRRSHQMLSPTHLQLQIADNNPNANTVCILNLHSYLTITRLPHHQNKTKKSSSKNLYLSVRRRRLQKWQSFLIHCCRHRPPLPSVRRFRVGSRPRASCSWCASFRHQQQNRQSEQTLLWGSTSQRDFQIPPPSGRCRRRNTIPISVRHSRVFEAD